MALHDLAQRSGFTHAVDNVVFLQLELPSSRPELRELFSCQLQIDDGTNEWRVSDPNSLYQKILNHPGQEHGKTGTVNIPASASRNFAKHTTYYRPFSLFGREALLQHVGNYGYGINARVRCLSVERQNGRIWLVRGEILSGGLIFGDQRVIAPGDRNRVWPNDNLRGIFFTGSELQIEVGDPGTFYRHQNSFPNQTGLDLDQVRVREHQGQSGMLFRAHRAGQQKQGEWKVIKEWDHHIITLTTPYTTASKPECNWHYEIYKGELPRRFRLLGVTRDLDTNAVERAVWEQTSATAGLSELLNEPPGLPIEPPANTGNRHFESVKALGSSLGITLTKPEQSASRAIVVVDGMDSTDPADFKRREFLRVDWNLNFDGRIGNVSWLPQTLLVHSTAQNGARYELMDRDDAESSLNAATSPGVDNRVQRLTFSGTLNPSTTFAIRFKDQVSGPINWSPDTTALRQNVQNALDALRTIGEGNTRVSQSKSPTITFVSASANADIPLLDVESVSAGANVTIDSLAAQVQFKWNRHDDAIQPTIPDTRLIGTALDANRPSTAEKSDKSREIWFQASCASSTPYAGLPPAWANITAQQPPAIPLGNGASISGLSGPIVYKTADEWSMEAAPADPQSGRATVTPGVRLTLTEVGVTKSAKLELFAADVILDSPKFPVYDKAINDPLSVPNERRPYHETTETSLRFIYRPEWERVPPENDNSVVCVHEDGNFVLHRTPQAIRLYLPAERALIDPVSVTRGNLVGRQIVAFPLLVIPEPQTSGVTLTVTDVRTLTRSDKTFEAQVDLKLEGADNADEQFAKLANHHGFFAQFELQPESSAPAVVLRIRALIGGGTERTLVCPIQADQQIPKKGKQYLLTVGPTRLALPRDVNHGLIPLGVSEFQISGLLSGHVNLQFDADKIRGEESQSVLALHPWTEWGPRPEASETPKKPWLTTGRTRLHHRNLIQEHAEFESSFEDRFPPEGPAKNPDGTVPSPLLPLADFERAVRDRYTEASGNTQHTSPAAKELRNWLPRSSFVDTSGDQVPQPQIKIALNSANLTELPKAEVDSQPFMFTVEGKEYYQTLKLRKTHKSEGSDPEYEADKVGADRHWLDVSVRPEALAVGSAPTIRLTKTDPTDVTSRRAVDSSVPLLFSRHDICALATIGVDDGRCIAIVGSPEQMAKSVLFAEDGSVSQAHDFPGDALVDVALLHHGDTIRGLAIRKTGSDVELIRFTVDQSTAAPTFDPVPAITLDGTPTSLVCTPEDLDASVFVLAENPTGLFKVNAANGDKDPIPNLGTNAKAISVDRLKKEGVNEYIRYLAIGYDDGHVSVRNDTASSWPEILRGDKRLKSSPLLGTEEHKLNSIPARSIRDLCVLVDPARLTVVAVDGTRFPCVWGTDSKDGTAARVWLQQSDALSVAFGRVQDLEQRPRFKITDDVITTLSHSGVPAEAVDALRSIKDEEFPSRTEFEHKLGELLEAAHQVHLQTILDHARIDSTVPLFALGLRTGTVRMSAPIGRSEGLTDIRQFDAAEAPVTRLALAGGGTAATLAVCFAGTSAGGLLAWDTRRGLEWSEAERVVPTTYLDALGVVRAVPSVAPSADWTVDELSLGTDTYYSVTTRSLDLVVDDPSGLAAEDITDIRLWADAFKVHADGTVESRQFPDGPFDPGHIAFFSNITANDKLTSLAALNHVPRLSGIPFFVTGVQNLNLSNDRSTVESAVVEGVLINPDEIAAGQDAADAGTLSGIVVRALSRCKPLVVRIESGAWSIVKSKIDWTFAVNRQEPVGDSKNFPGKIARIVGRVSKTEKARLSIAVDAAKSRALVFGRLWPFSESVTTVSRAAFERASDDGPWLQTQFSFESEGGSAASLTIMSNEDEELSPVASLGIDFGNVLIGGARLSGRLVDRVDGDLRVARCVQFIHGADDAHAQIEQGGYRCLTVKPPSKDNTRGQQALLLWTSGDLGSAEAENEAGPLRLCAALVRMETKQEQLRMETKQEQQTSALTFVDGSGNEIGKCSATVHQSHMNVEVNSDGNPKTVAMFGTVLIEATLRGQELWLLLEGNVQSASTEMTGQLVLKAGTTVALQATVRAKLNLEAKTIELFDDVFWAAFITPESTVLKPEIRMPRVSGTKSPAFSANGYTFERVPPRGFVRIGLTKVSNEIEMGTRSVDRSLLPLLPELEPSLVQAPERIGNNDVRLSHRSRAGLALRPNAPSGRFGIALNTATAGKTSLPSLPTGQALLLDTVVSTAGPLLRLRPEGWLVPTTTTDTYRTDGLFVLNVDFRRGDMPVVAAVEARTRNFDPEEPSPNERERYRELLRATGDQGVAITYRLTDGVVADLGFVDSPFYDHAGEVDLALRLVASTSPAGLAKLATAMEAVPEPAWIYGFDPRIRLPSTLPEQLSQRTTGRYVVADLAADPYADVCCLAHRQYRLERRRLTDDAEEFDPSATPILHNSEVPAFRQPARLSSQLSGRWMRTEPADDKPFIPRVFFPPRVDWELAADKPGAMFQSLVQARVTTKERATSREPLIDFALREPQFTRLAKCVSAEVYWQTDLVEIAVSPPDSGYANVNLVWTEVIGSVQVDDEKSGDWLKPTATGIALSRTPLQLVIDFNSEVFLVNQADAAVPAYRVEAQPDEGVPSVKVLPATTFLLANPDVARVFTPQTVAEYKNKKCIIDDAGKATVTGLTLQSGTALTLSGFSQAELDDISHRFVGTSGGPSFDLMQDTGTEDDLSTITVDGTDYTVAIRGRRPLCVTLERVTNPNPFNGKPLTIPDTSGKVRRLHNGEEVTALRLAQVAIDQNQFLIVTPTEVATRGEGKCHAVATQADGFLEAAIRVPAKVAADLGKAWTPALKLSKTAALEDLKLVGEHKLVRLESRNPAASGVFGVLGPDNLLARPVVGNGLTHSGGKARIFDGTDVDLIKVEGVTPIVVVLASDPGWNEGTTPVVVREARGVPQANGSWVVQKLVDDPSGKKRFALFEPSVAEVGTSTTIDAIASAVIPLREAFVKVMDREGKLILRLRRLDLDPKWIATDRPLLQIHWAGSRQFLNEDGKGIAWRLGGVMVGLYEQIKQVKFLANSQLSPKLAFVMTAPAGTSWQRTILFGDSAPPFKAEPSIKTVEAGSITTTHFFLKIPNNRESLSVPVPQGVNSDDFVLHLVKSLPSGVAIYDRYTKGSD